jgi:dihydroflavonol-4-reductase
MKALVTGATGFVGNHVARAAARRGLEVRVLARPQGNYLNTLDKAWEVAYGDVRDADSVREAVRGCDAVFHVAALYAFWPRDRRPYYETNVVGTRNVLSASVAEGVRRVVHTSSWVTVGRPRDGHAVSDERDATSPSELTGPYRYTKWLAEQEAMEFAAKGLDVVVVNPTAPVGPGDARPTPTGRLVLDFLRSKLPAYVDALLDLVAVEDVAEGHVRAWERGRSGERYVLAGEAMTLRGVLETLSEVTGLPGPRVKAPRALALAAAYVDGWVEGGLLRREPVIPLEGVQHAGRRVRVDSGKAMRELGYTATPVREALTRAVSWYRQHGYV